MKLNNHQKGVSLIILSVLFFSISSIAVKSIPGMPNFERIFFMNTVAVLFMMTRKTKDFKAEIISSKWLLSLRAFLGFISTITYYYALNHVILADATLLNKTSPFFVSFFSVIFLKEKVTLPQIFAMIIAGIGAVLVINPSFDVTVIPALVGMFSGASAAGAYTVIRKLNNKVHPNNIVFFFMLFSAIASLPLMLLDGFVMPTLFEFSMMVVMGVALSLGQICLSFAYKFEEASKISIYSFAQIVMSLLFGYFIFSEQPTATTLIGGLIIFAGGYINYKVNLNNIKKEKKALKAE